MSTLTPNVVILQHPSEKKEPLNTIPWIRQVLPQCNIQIGLSWSGLKKVTADPGAIPSQWWLVYSGSPKDLERVTPEGKKRGAELLHPSGKPLTWSTTDLVGIILIDGSWPQAKTLFWRNRWLLKLKRVVILPPRSSAYGKLRKEPRKEALSTLEALAYTLTAIDANNATAPELHEILKTKLDAL